MRFKMSNIPLILEGWGNVVKDEFNILDPKIKQLASARMLICDNCEIRDGSACDPEKCGTHVETGEIECGCGCNIAAKTLSPNSECPLGKWKKVTSYGI